MPSVPPRVDRWTPCLSTCMVRRIGPGPKGRPMRLGIHGPEGPCSLRRQKKRPSGNGCDQALKGCLDGNNTTIYERPPHAQEFIIWSLCSNRGADPRHNAWSGIHTRLSADIIERAQQVDGVIIWDWVCGTIGRPCPKLRADPTRTTVV